MLVAAAALAPYTDDMLTPGQIRAARALLGWTQVELAARSGVAEITIKKIEGGADARGSTLEKLRLAFWEGGVEFLADGAPAGPGGPGLRLRKATKPVRRQLPGKA